MRTWVVASPNNTAAVSVVLCNESSTVSYTVYDTSFIITLSVGEKTTTGKPFDETARLKLNANEYIGL